MDNIGCMGHGWSGKDTGVRDLEPRVGLFGEPARNRERVMFRTLTIALLTGLSISAFGCSGSSLTKNAGPHAQAGTSLERDGFSVLYFRAIQSDYGVVSVVGEVRNVGATARGVELQAALRDANGRVVAVGHFCPASYKNIAPGETWPFSYSFGKQEGIVKAEMRIVGAFRTLDVLDAASSNQLE